MKGPLYFIPYPVVCKRETTNAGRTTEGLLNVEWLLRAAAGVRACVRARPLSSSSSSLIRCQQTDRRASRAEQSRAKGGEGRRSSEGHRWRRCCAAVLEEDLVSYSIGADR
ncbi:hypothetical protein Mp_3g19410 [Marchantia polymorpha subsp. ruderalis]|uniref:Uncharacterized protein n=2 Tax=Marchantia polymorpha TaxID=3197 RepID=A0AAF6B2J5_MARPO|nr:hypothetical protein MARPO_0049s0093 [Marchantia polymorpha]BBN06229.1 hypothetical protein Mp_3g19410 [Marchantia polymorpha subsp. ruderalis]|eukprot:PTQ38814.1 hypothetical protein MARPO_0049s0093 [Marchantia polymorpha]